MNQDHKRKLILWLFALGVAVPLLGLALFGWTRTWDTLQIPSPEVSYADMRTVQAAPAAVDRGLDPQVVNPGDPWGRPMNYPRIWVAIARVCGLAHEANFLGFVTAYVAAFVFCVFHLLRKYPSFWLLAAILSGSTLLGVERGNNDLVIFCILYLSVFLASPWLCAALITTCAVLKIYPVFAALSVLKYRRVFIALVLVLLVVLLFNVGELAKARAATPVSAGLSYGAPSLAAIALHLTRRAISPYWIDAALLALSAALTFSGLTEKHFAREKVSDAVSSMFLLGGGIYVATFAIASNFDYRLVFLILCIPYLLQLKNRLTRNMVLLAILFASDLLLFRRTFGLLSTAAALASEIALFVLIASLLYREVLNAQPGLRLRPKRV